MSGRKIAPEGGIRHAADPPRLRARGIGRIPPEPSSSKKNHPAYKRVNKGKILLVSLTKHRENSAHAGIAVEKQQFRSEWRL
jgi:hypothetical protein